jgi:hypothetical protein
MVCVSNPSSENFTRLADLSFSGIREYLALVALVRVFHQFFVKNHGTNNGTDENLKMTDCYFEKKDWRACKNEV